jgi:hypothetical protein
MGLVTFNNLAQHGVIEEVPDHATPMNAWTTGINVTFRDDHVQAAKGYTPVTDMTVARPQFLMPYYDPEAGTLHWIAPGIDASGPDVGKIETFDGTTHTDRTQAGNYLLSTRWNGAIVNGLAVVNNQVGIPQMWDRTGGILNADFEDLTNWPTNHTAAVLRGFRNFFVCLDINDSSAGTKPDRNPYEIMHSGIVDSYTAPEWAPATTNRAGSKYIGEGGGVLVDCLPLRGVNIIYSESEAWPMSYVGGNEVFAIGDKALLEYGMMTQGCAAAFGAGSHFVVSVGDIIVHDGANAQSIIDGKVRDNLFADIDPVNFVNSFVVSHYSEGEIWFCYPGIGSTYPNKIAKWNIKANVWSFMELPIETSMIRFGAIPQGTNDGAWADDSGQWNADSSIWNEGNYNPTIRDLMMVEYGATPAASSLKKVDDGIDFDGTSFKVTLQKTGIIVAGNGQSGPYSDPNVDKFFDEVWPRVEGGIVSVRLGTAQFIAGPYTWTDPQDFDSSVDRKLDFRPIEGYYGAIEFTSEGVEWHLDGFDLNVQATGSRG